MTAWTSIPWHRHVRPGSHAAPDSRADSNRFTWQGLEQLNEALAFLQSKKGMAVAGPAFKQAAAVRARLLRICEEQVVGILRRSSKPLIYSDLAARAEGKVSPTTSVAVRLLPALPNLPA